MQKSNMVSRSKNKIKVHSSVSGYGIFFNQRFYQLWNNGIMEFVYGIME